MSEGSDRIAVAGATAAPGRISRRTLLMVGGGIAAGSALGAGLGVLLRADANAPLLDAVPTQSLAQVQSSLAPDTAARLMAEAERCREPLAHVTIRHSRETPGGMLSIISGRYHSPRFMLTTTPSLVALPYPAPYPAGRGVLTLTGEANDVIISLTPGKLINLAGSVIIPVRWHPRKGCP